jgi:hypothetical protein
LLVEDGEAEIIEHRTMDTREWVTVRTVGGELFSIVWFIPIADYHLGFELRNDFIVMDIGESSFSVQWPKGDIASGLVPGDSIGGVASVGVVVSLYAWVVRINERIIPNDLGLRFCTSHGTTTQS